MAFRYRMTGQQRVSKVFRHLREVPVHAGLRTGVEAAARLVRAEARERVPKRTGLAARRMVAEIVYDGKGRGIVRAAVGPHKKHGWYVLFHEIGFRGRPARPFLRPAFDENLDKIRDRVGEVYWENLNRVAASLRVVTEE